MEQWRDIPRWEGKYQVSDRGNVRSLDRVVIAFSPKGVLAERKYRGKQLAVCVGKKGYALFCLVENTRKEYRYGHDLVAEAFIGPRPPGLEVCHGNNIRNDNTLCNLRYDTRSANAQDRHVHGTIIRNYGEAAASAKLTNEDVWYIRKNFVKGEWSIAARELGVSPTTVSMAAKRISWPHI